MNKGSDLAIICGSGRLPEIIKEHYSGATCVVFDRNNDKFTNKVIFQDFEKLGNLLNRLKDSGVTRLVMAGAISRPKFDRGKLDSYTSSILLQLNAKLAKGDNELLSFIASELEKNSFKIVGATEILPNLTVKEGLLAGEPYENYLKDVEKADAVLKKLSIEDVGQGVVVENGLVLGIETLQGTNALLKFVSQTSEELRSAGGGLFVKRPKTNQDLRFDMPTVGPETVSWACNAGLRGLVLSPQKVIILILMNV